MKKIKLLIGVLLLSTFKSSFAVPYEIILQQLKFDGSQYLTRFLPVPTSNSVLIYDPSTNLPTWAALNHITYSSGVLTPDIPTFTSQLTNDSGFVTSVSYPVTSVNTKTGAVVLTSSDVGADASGLAASAQATAIQRSNHTGTQPYTTITGLGTSATLNVASSGNASSGEVVKGNDTRLAVIYSGTTDSNGNYTVTYGSAYSLKPKIVFAVEGGTNKDTSVLSSTSTTGFTIKVERRTDIAGLLPTYANVIGAVVNVSVTQ